MEKREFNEDNNWWQHPEQKEWEMLLGYFDNFDSLGRKTKRKGKERANSGNFPVFVKIDEIEQEYHTKATQWDIASDYQAEIFLELLHENWSLKDVEKTNDEMMAAAVY